MLRLWKKAVAPSHEELFIQHYEQLYAWALRLTEQDRQRAEDLVHDVFIQFTLTQPDLDKIENLEGYLFAILRNLLRSQIRREARRVSGALTLVDYDSVEIRLRFTDPRTLIQAQDELRTICHYACTRKETSKAGSAFILRFFLGYYPGEIALLLRNSRHAVEELLKAARGEAKLYLSHPNQLRFMHERPAAESSRRNSALATDDFIGDLSATIFRSCQGACLPERKLRDCYRASGEQQMDTKTLAHLVSCPRCLDIVNQELGLPPLADRYPTDSFGPDRRDRGDKGDSGGSHTGGGSGAGSAQNAVKKFHRRLREIVEHEPKELRVAVNGQALGALTLSSEMNKLNLHIEETEKIGFIEIFSEQGLRLLSLNVAPPPEGSFEQEARAAFSNQRTLTVSLHFNGAGADLQMVYQNPLASPEVATVSTVLTEVEELPAGEQDNPEKPPHRFLAMLDPLRSRLFDLSFRLHPGVLTATVLVILIATLLFFRLPERRVSAAELLRRTAVAEASLASRTDLALHRTLSLEESDPASGRIISRRRVEVWQSAAKGIKARRLYDEQNQLIAGEWQQANGSRTVYRKQKVGEEPQIEFRNPQSAIRNLEVWQLELSASDFTALVGRADAAQVEEKPSAYVISYESEAGARGLLKAMLTLGKDDLHPIEQTLLVSEGREVREYRFVEVSYERRPASAVAPAMFDPDPELLERMKDESRRMKLEIKPVLPSPLIPYPSPVVATAELEIELLHLLSQAKADLGEQVNVVRTPDGSLRIEGIVDTERRKSEILHALGPVTNRPALTIDVNTAMEALQQRPQSQRPSGSVIVQQVEPAENKIPVDQELRRYLSGRGLLEAQLDAEIVRFADRTLARSRQALLRAGTLKRLVNRFSPQDLRTLDAEARAKWSAMIQAHAGVIQRETIMLWQELQPVFFPSSSAALLDGAEEEPAITDESDLVAAADRLFALCSANERSVNSAFTLSANTSLGAAIKTPLFRRSLKSAEELAAKINQWSVASSHEKKP